MPDRGRKATLHFAYGGISPAYAAIPSDLVLILPRKALKRPQSGAAFCDSGVLVCILT
ncbi:hypothetical protein [Ruegeria sp. EL01]|uniref:hypothetical protein n=1 Tax=Ruegeria sp. EL01 TaxID=2107578 RepID=UPI001C1F85EE|nr:hypothetical protein [Ruegeria sp. EL01]